MPGLGSRTEHSPKHSPDSGNNVHMETGLDKPIPRTGWRSRAGGATSDPSPKQTPHGHWVYLQEKPCPGDSFCYVNTSPANQFPLAFLYVFFGLAFCPLQLTMLNHRIQEAIFRSPGSSFPHLFPYNPH